MGTNEDPWKSGPAELIGHAIEHLRRDTDFDRRIGFLLLDVGVETLFKVFLTLPAEATHALGGHTRRRSAARGIDIKQPKTSKSKVGEPSGDSVEGAQAADPSFHVVVKGVWEAAGNRLADFNPTHVEFYHDIRNRLYHEGNDITVFREKAQKYAELAVGLLKALLHVDLSAQLQQLEIEAHDRKESAERIGALWEHLAGKERDLETELRQYREEVELFIEHLEPKLPSPTFRRRFEALCAAYIRPASDSKERSHAGHLTWPPWAERARAFEGELVKLVEEFVTNPLLREKLSAPTEVTVPGRFEVRTFKLGAVAAALLVGDRPQVEDLYVAIANILRDAEVPPWPSQRRTWRDLTRSDKHTSEAERLEQRCRSLETDIAYSQGTRLRFKEWRAEYAAAHVSEAF